MPNDTLVSADSLELITFPRTIPVTVSPVRFDSFTQHLAYWKGIVLRNFSIVDVLQYRTDPNGTLIDLPISSERPIKGWGSFFEVQGVVPNGEFEIEMVTVKNAVRRQ